MLELKFSLKSLGRNIASWYLTTPVTTTTEFSVIHVLEPTIYDEALPDSMAQHMREPDKRRDEGQGTDTDTPERTRSQDLHDTQVAREKPGPDDTNLQAVEPVTADSTQPDPREPRPSHEEPARPLTSRSPNDRTCRQALRLNEVLHPSRPSENQTDVPSCFGSNVSLSRPPFPPEREEIEAEHDLASPRVTPLTPVMIETPIRNMIRLSSLRGRRRCGPRLLSRNVPTFLVPHSPNSISVW